MIKSKKQKILIVDDGVDISIVLTNYIKKLGYKVEVVNSGYDALESIKKTNFDLILLDLVMPKLNGLEVLKKIKSVNKNIKVIIMTAYKDAEKIVELFRNGAIDCIFKPLDLKILKNILSEKLKK